jgi:hypothetical protein
MKVGYRWALASFIFAFIMELAGTVTNVYKLQMFFQSFGALGIVFMMLFLMITYMV